MITKKYSRILPTFFGRQYPDDAGKAFFADCGLTFPDGSALLFYPLKFELFVRNTPENHALLDALLGVWYPHVCEFAANLHGLN